ncbi:MAG: type II secretion system protein [Candidatus Paceibacterota bacterium]|jgi:prepilin-type N-terminal cleavage/methylation domain-containing protein
MFKKSKKGFTLIELLVVVAIISLLSSIVMASLNSARAKARDAQKKTELRQMATALEMYFDKNNTYPPNKQPCCVYFSTNGDFLVELINEGFLSKKPHPAQGSYWYYDYGRSNICGWILATSMEATSSANYPGTTGRCSGSGSNCGAGGAYYCVTEK